MRSVKEVMENLGRANTMSELFDIPDQAFYDFCNNLHRDLEHATKGEMLEVKMAANLLREVLTIEDFTSEELLRMVMLNRWLRDQGKRLGKHEVMKGMCLMFD